MFYVQVVIFEINDLLKQVELNRKSDEHQLNESIEIFSHEDDIGRSLMQMNYSFIDTRQFLNICSKEYDGNLEIIQDFEPLYSLLITFSCLGFYYAKKSCYVI